ncbi:MAG: 3D domain-containing protein [Phycisphaerales bacterium JB063]
MPQPDADNPTLTLPMRVRVARVAFTAGGVVFAGLLGWTTWQSFERASDPPALAALESSDSPATAPRPGIAWSVMQREDGEPTTPAPADSEADALGPGHAEPASPPAAQPESAQAGGDPVGDEDVAELPSEHHDAGAAAVVGDGTAGPADPLGVSALHPSQTRDEAIIVDGQPWTGPTFDGRPIRPARTVTMTTTAYSPDEQSCGIWADGITASGMSVWTNGMKLVAADPSIPFGTILTVPGYNDGHPVPVLDRGGAIKGNRLDLLYPTHEIAMQWGVQELEVVVWEYADE